jgi:YYY domain-containing protein
VQSLTQILIWWLALAVVGALAWPITFAFFRRLPGGGYAFARITGLLLVSYVVWILNLPGILPFSLTGALIAAGIILLIDIALMARDGWSLGAGLVRFMANKWRYIAVCEIIFALALVSLAVLRGFTPDIYATEKPMDFALLNSIVRHDRFSPTDPWLSGNPINYYYFGYFMVALITKLLAMPPAVAFNLAVPTFLALAFLGAFGVGFDVLSGLAGAGKRAAYGLAALGAVLVAIAGNLYGGLHLLAAPSATLAADWWSGIGWNSSRIITDVIFGQSRPTINESPFFSFSLADMHPHLMALPFTILALGVSLTVWVDRHAGWDPRSGIPAWLCKTSFAALVLGSLYIINSWDFPTYLLVFLLSVVLVLRPTRRSWTPFASAGLAAVLSVLLFLPFYLTFTSVVGAGALPLPPEVTALPLVGSISRYIGIVIWEKTSLGDFLTIFGLVFLAAGPFTAFQGLKAVRDRALGGYVKYVWLAVGLLAAIVAGVVFRFPLLTLLPPIIILGGYFDYRSRPSAAAFAVLISIVALLLIFGCELVFLQDAFHDRMNTVFKFYYQAWTLLGIAAPISLYLGVRQLDEAVGRREKGGARAALGFASNIWIGAAGVLLALALVYPGVATYYKVRDSGGFKGLDGSAYLATYFPADYEAIKWLSSSVSGDPVVLEASGPPYSTFARISTFTGLPTVLGWANHENQWRAGQAWATGEISKRDADIDTIYSTTDLVLARQLLNEYNVQYVVVGAVERGVVGSGDYFKQYPPAGLDKFSRLGKVVFRSGDTAVYQVGG